MILFIMPAVFLMIAAPMALSKLREGNNEGFRKRQNICLSQKVIDAKTSRQELLG